MTTIATTHKHGIRMIRVGDLTRHPDVQRQKFTESKAQRIADHFDPDKLMPLVVMSVNGKLYVIDGAHRLRALQILGYDDCFVECDVYEGLTDAEAAKIFRAQSDRTAVLPVDDFIVALIEGDPDATIISGIVASVGGKVGNGNRSNTISAVTALRRLYRPNGGDPRPDVLRETLGIIAAAWGINRESAQGLLIDGIGRVVAGYRGRIDLSVLRSKLARTGGGASGLIGRARTVRMMYGGSMPDAIATIVVSEYNKQRRSGKLPEWRASTKTGA